MHTLRSLVVVSIAMLTLTANAQKFTCRAPDLFDANGKRPLRGMIQIKKNAAYHWKFEDLKAGEVKVEATFVGEGSGKLVVSIGDQKLEVLGNTGKDKKGKPHQKNMGLGTINVPAGKAIVTITVTGDLKAKLRYVNLTGSPMAEAKIDSYALPAPERTPVAVKDLGIANNTLTEKEKADGWQLLFNGKDLTGWAGYRKEHIPAAWRIDNGQLFLDKASKKEGGDLISVNKYTDFELMVDWKISKGGNSGLILKAHEDKMAPWETAIEMQVHDPHGSHNHLTNAGAAYALFAPKESPAKPAGEWNTARIIVKGNHYQMWLNGAQTADFTVGSDRWKKQVAVAKWRMYPYFGHNKEGQLDLQDHGNPVWYRNIKIRPIK